LPAIKPSGAGALQFAFNRRVTGTTALVYEPLYSADLSTWFPLTDPAPIVTPAPDPNLETVAFTLAPSAGERKFFRVRVTLP
jgi:hypothetical protein